MQQISKDPNLVRSHNSIGGTILV